MVFHLPFELGYWFLWVFAGDIKIFTAIAIITIMTIAAMFRMPYVVAFFSIFLFMFLFINAGANKGIVLLFVAIGVIVIIPILMRMLK